MSHDENLKEPQPSCVVPNAALSPSEVMRLYSRGDISPLANTFQETELVERPAHTDPLLALSQAQDFNSDMTKLSLQPVSPAISQDHEPPAAPPAQPPAE